MYCYHKYDISRNGLQTNYGFDRQDVKSRCGAQGVERQDCAGHLHKTTLGAEEPRNHWAVTIAHNSQSESHRNSTWDW